MKKVFIVHGFRGEPNGGWRPWLMSKLAQNGVYACALPMPTPDAPKKDEWVAEIARAVAMNNPEETYLVGHSLGVPAILRYLETMSPGVRLGGAVLVSGPVSVLRADDPTAKIRRIDHFLDTPFHYSLIREKADSFRVIHGLDDDNVPFSHAELLAKELQCELIAVPKGGHLNGDAGWYELPEVLEGLLSMTK